MRIASFLSSFQDEIIEIFMEGNCVKRIPMYGQEHIGTGRGIGKVGSKDGKIFLKVVKQLGEMGGQIDAKGIDPAITLTDFEFVASEGQPPMPLCVLIQIAMQLHFANIAL